MVMAHEPDPDFKQDLGLYLNALKQYDINYGPKPQDANGLGGQNYQVRANNSSPGYGYINPQTNEPFPLYPETGGFEQPNPGLEHPPELGEPPPLQGRANYYVPYTGGDGGQGGGEPILDAWGRDISNEGKPYSDPYTGAGGGYGVYTGGDEN
jgi:hypothetical protein